jgi:hypothetical protein
MSLQDKTFVVRGGEAQPETLVEGTCEHETIPGLVGFSVQSANEVSVEDLAQAATLPHRRISVATVGQIRAIGLDVVSSPGRGHHATVNTRGPLPFDLAQKISSLFERRNNPYRVRPRTTRGGAS